LPPPRPPKTVRIFRPYEENVGTITPLVGERLLEAVELYPSSGSGGVRAAARLNVRN
jgi:hypothetical protein